MTIKSHEDMFTILLRPHIYIPKMVDFILRPDDFIPILNDLFIHLMSVSKSWTD